MIYPRSDASGRGIPLISAALLPMECRMPAFREIHVVRQTGNQGATKGGVVSLGIGFAVPTDVNPDKVHRRCSSQFPTLYEVDRHYR